MGSFGLLYTWLNLAEYRDVCSSPLGCEGAKTAHFVGLGIVGGTERAACEIQPCN